MSIFEQLRVKSGPDKGLFFLLQFSSEGAFIETVDKDGAQADFDYRQYGGVICWGM